MPAQPIRVLLVDDHVVVRRGLAALLPSAGNVQVVGEAADGDEALRLVKDVQPDVVLMDLSMPRLSGIEATRRLRQAHPAVRILVLSMHEDEAFVAQALKVGASGYVVKQSTPEEVLMAIEAVASGGVFISPMVVKPIVEEYLRQSEAEQNLPASTLTGREHEVLQLIAEGHTTDEIAKMLAVSPHTVQHHRSSLKRKLGARSNADLVKIAIKKNLLLNE